MHVLPSLLLLLGAFALVARGLDNGLARTPPMGWLTWERFRCNIDCKTFPDQCIGERLIMNTADLMSVGGWLKAGYEYLIVDDCWASHQRKPDGSLQADPVRFPRGMKAVADYVHSRGLKFGIYGDIGTKTCGGFPGQKLHMKQDAETFASWGVDYVKLDGCYSDPKKFVPDYVAFGAHLNGTGRPMVYSCSWPAYQCCSIQIDSATLKKTCNLWRIFGDIQDSWASVKSIIGRYAANPQNFSTWAGPGHWNDPDMLIIGNFGLSPVEERAQMGMWAMFAAPLIMSVDLRTIRNESRAILQNPSLIAINQDPLGREARLIQNQNGISIWNRQLSHGAYAVACLGTGEGGSVSKLTYKLSQLGVEGGGRYNLFEAFTGEFLGRYTSGSDFSFFISSPGFAMFVAYPS